MAPKITQPRVTKVVSYSGGGKTRVEVRSLRAPGRGEMLVRLRSCGLCGTDLFKLSNDTVTPGAVLGHEIVGIVEELGEGTEGFAVGERVLAPHHVSCGQCALCLRGSDPLCSVFRENLLEPGGFSEHVLVRERAVRLAARKMPAGVSDEAAIFLEPAACVLRGIWRAGVPAGLESSCAVVLGAGSMGLLHLLVLRAADPAIRVIVSDTLEERLRLAVELGAHAAATPREIGPLVREVTAGLGADAAFDTVGGSGILESAVAMTREGGSVVLFAHAPAGDRARFDLNEFFKHERRIVGTYSGSLKEQQEVFRWIVAGRLDASRLITHRLPFSRFDEAVAMCRRLEALKILLVPDEEGS